MNRYDPDPPPPPTTVTPSPAEIIEAYPIPRKYLAVALRVGPGTDPAGVLAAAARFVAAVQAADRRLRLTVDPAATLAAGEVTLTFTPARHGAEVAERLEKLVAVARDAAAAFAGATLTRAEVVARV